MLPDLIIIPTYNERENIRALVPEIVAVRPTARIWVVDDNSPDGTADEVRRLSEEFPQVALILRQKKEGLGRAYTDALTRAKKENFRSVVLMDADGSHDPKYLPEMLSNISPKSIVIGSRYVQGGAAPGWEWWRTALSAGGNFYARILTGLPAHDLTAGFIALGSNILKQLDLSAVNANGYAFLIELKYRALRDCGGELQEVPIRFAVRREGESKISSHIVWEGIRAPLRLFAERIFKL